MLSSLAPSGEVAATPPASARPPPDAPAATGDTYPTAPPGASAPDLELTPGARVGRFVVLSRVGAGGMGVVYAAYDPELNRKLALKLLRPDRGGDRAQGEVEARLRREAQAMAKLAHPNVATVYDVGAHEGRVFVAMEFVEGATLARWLEQKQRPRAQVLEAFRAVGRGLAAAHAAGLVHRDVKPQNVLCGDDGRVRVVDFGLARAAAGGRAAEAPPPEEAATLTLTGALVGTPAYMAPEQLRGEPADEASDQFSFCVALYEALYGERPFAGRTLGELLAAVESGRVRAPSPGARVPSRLRSILLRGLSAAPGGRFPSMHALLAELEREPGRRLRRAALAGAALAFAAGGALAARQLGERGPLCKGAERHLTGVWDGPRRQAVEAALRRTGAPYAEMAVREVGRALDAYAAGWVAQHTEACEATRMRGEQTEEVLGLRMACLDDRRRDLKALGDRLAEADRDVAERAAEAVSRLADLATCTDVRALARPLRLPTDVTSAAEVERLRGALADARSLYGAGKYREGLEVARPLVERARGLHYRPLEAEALFLVGDLAAESGDYQAAADRCEQAVLAAEAGRHDELLAQALTKLVQLDGSRPAPYQRVESLEQRATAVLERLGDPAELESALRMALGFAEIERGRYAEGQRAIERALSLLEAKYGPNDLRLAAPLLRLGQAADNLHEFSQAQAYIDRALDLRRRFLGDGHPAVGTALHAAAIIQAEQHDYPRAEATFRQALTTLETSLGPEHPSVANSLFGLGHVLNEEGRSAEAVPLLRRAVAIGEKAFGGEHPRTLHLAGGLAEALKAEGRLAESLALLERAVAVLRPRLGDENPEIGELLQTVGEVQLRLGRLDAARGTMQRVDALLRAALGPDYPAGPVLQTIGEIHLRQERWASAAETLERALLQHGQNDDDPRVVATTKALLAEALWALGRDRARARVLAFEARAGLTGAPAMGAELAVLERWMHQIRLL